jgi:hypothetical protein
MISIDQVHVIAEANNIRIHNSWEPTTFGRELPKLLSMRLCFTQEAAEAWETLASDRTEVPLVILGTRQTTGSGATDNMLYPAYRELLTSVNLKRAQAGLDPIQN